MGAIRWYVLSMRACNFNTSVMATFAWAASILFVGHLIGCGDDGPESDAAGTDAAGTDSGTDAPTDSPPLADVPAIDAGPGPCTPGDDWLMSEQTFGDDTVLVERVQFCSDGLTVAGQVCRPASEEAGGVILLNHDGFEGLGETELDRGDGLCGRLASMGHVVAMPAFRGQGDSEGEIEICSGEAKDAATMLRIASSRDYADPERRAVMGLGHGGCVAVSQALDNVDAQTVVALFPWLDLAETYTFWQSQRSEATPEFQAQYDDLSTLLRNRLGGAPGDSAGVDAGYEALSVVARLSQLDTFAGTFVLIQGTADEFMPLSPLCNTLEAVMDMSAYHALADGGAARSVCDDSTVEWLEGVPRVRWPSDRYGGFYELGTHSTEGDVNGRMVDDAVDHIISVWAR